VLGDFQEAMHHGVFVWIALACHANKKNTAFELSHARSILYISWLGWSSAYDKRGLKM